MDGPKPWGRSLITWSGLRVAIMLGASCGLRAQDVCGLTWDHIDHDFGEVNIEQSVKGGWGKMLHVGPPKSEAGTRKVPLTFRGREIISEHAHIYKDYFGDVNGWPVGYVLRPSFVVTKTPYVIPSELSGLFRRLVTEAKILNPDGTPVHFHQLRHWFASVGVKHHSDKHYVKKVIGHSQLAMLLDRYADYLPDEELREKFLAMPDWLDPDRRAMPVQPMLSAPPGPIMIPANGGGAPELLGTAENVVIEAAAPEGDAVAERPCPLDVPDTTPAWLRSYITMIDDRWHQRDACRALGTRPEAVVEALRVYLKIDGQMELRRRLRRKKVVALINQGYGDVEVTMKLGFPHKSRAIVQRIAQDLHKGDGYNPLKRKKKSPAKPKLDTRPQHKRQLKLL